MSNRYKYFKEFLSDIPVLSTHQHHMEDEKQRKLDLQTIFENSYVGWCSVPKDTSDEERRTWLDGIRTNSYFVWLEKALASIYNFDVITPENWDSISQKIKTAHQEDENHIRLLKKHGKYMGFLEDCFWNTGSDLGHPDFVTPVYRIDMWIQGFHPNASDNDGQNPHKFYNATFPDFDTYIEKFKDELLSKRPRIAGLKCAQAYQRSIYFEETSYEKAKSVYGKTPSQVSEEERNNFGNYMLHTALEMAERLDLPVQFHTGLARLKGSSPLLLENVIAAYPKVRFVLFHGGFPWTSETAALAHNYGNIILDINWLPLISTTAASQALHVYMETLRDNRCITWGADTWTSEEAVGAALAFRHILAQVLSEKVEQGYFSLNEAGKFAHKIMYKNAKEIYY